MLEHEHIKLIFLASIYTLLFFYEQYQPYFHNRIQHTRHTLRNLLLALINATLSSLLMVFIIRHVIQWTQEHHYGLLNQFSAPAIMVLLAALLLMDCWQYLWHRANHIIPLLWKFHQLHHSDKDMDASTSLRFHPIEIMLSGLLRVAIIPLAGLQLEHLIIYEIILLPIIFFHHSNIRINEKLDKLLRVVIVTPHIHRLHHSQRRNETDSNYASVLSVWDRLFNSYTMRPTDNNFTLGLDEKFDRSEWNTLAGMIAIPFKRKDNQIKRQKTKLEE